MVSQTINLPSSWSLGDTSGTVQWEPPTGQRPEILEGLTDPATRFRPNRKRYLARVSFRTTGIAGAAGWVARLDLSDSQTDPLSHGGDDLSRAWEQGGIMSINAGGSTLTLTPGDSTLPDTQNPTEPYDEWMESRDSISSWAFANRRSFSGTLVLDDRVPVPVNAKAPTVTINPVPSGGERSGEILSAVLSGGKYDTIRYSWKVSGGRLSGNTEKTPFWTRPNVVAPTTYTIDLSVTVTGTGTIAINGTSDISSATQIQATVTPNKPISVGTSQVLRISIGNTPVRKVSIGDDLIWEIP